MGNIMFTVAVLIIYTTTLFVVNIPTEAGQEELTVPEIHKPCCVIDILLTIVTAGWAVISIIIQMMLIGLPGAPDWINVGIPSLIILRLGTQIYTLIRRG